MENYSLLMGDSSVDGDGGGVDGGAFRGTSPSRRAGTRLLSPDLGFAMAAALEVPEDVPVPPAPVTEEANDNDHETSSEVATEPRRSTRERTTPDWYDPCLNVMIVDNNDEDPATYEEAMMSPDSNKWQEAMKSEMGSMYDNKVWTLVDLPDSRKAVENKWIFKRKTDADGNVTIYKARLVAKGFRQIQGVDYDETFSPVAKLKSVRILLAIAAFFDYEIWQMDVKTAFLNGDIEEELYMVQPKGFVDPKNADKSGYVFILNGATVSWCSSKQCTVAKSSTESEYIAASEASSEAVWMKRFIVELGVVPSALDPLVIYCDNMGAIANAQEPRSHKKLKHIKLRFHSIREYIEDGEVNICKVHTDLNVADPLTKALPRAKHDQHQNAMGVSMNIISGSCLMQDGYSFKSENNGCSIFMNNIFYGHAPEKNGLFLLSLDSSDTHVHNIDAKRIKLNDNSTYMWHCRLGHIGVKRMKKLHSDGLLESLDFESLDRCEACLMGKMTKTPFSGIMERATDLLEIIHTDVCGPMSVASRGGYRYVLTFTDDLSRYGYIYFMKHKSETFQKFKEFQSEVENQRNKKIKFLRSDRGGEYLSYEFGMHLKKCGILSQLTPPGTPQRNGVSERRNRTLLDMVRSMMSLTDLPLSFWGYALETAAFTLNRAPSKSVETTPYELWFNKKPKLSFLKVWGCEAYVKKLQPDKLEPKAEKCVFIGYPKETIGYTFYHKSEGKIFVAKNGTFLEKEFLTKEVTGRKVELDEVTEPSLVDQSSAVPEDVPVPPAPVTEEANDNDHETSSEVATEPRRSTRERTTPDWYDPCLNVMIVDNNDEDPATYEEAMMSPDSNKWQEAMKSEMGSMYDNKVWTLVDLPDSRKAVENKWIFKRKTDADGNVTVYKARLVAKGFRQIQGVDYDETFSPVAKLKSVRILLAIAAFFDYEIWQMDVKTAFLNGDIEEELYMVQPKGFVDPKNADKVCKLQRSIYGLKQASRSWNRRFDKVIKDFGFIQCHGEACIYKKVSGSSVAFLILYVDDILLIGNDIELLSSVKGYLNKCFSMKDLGEAAYILGIKIYRDRSRRLIGLSQSTYLDKILKKFRMDESKKGFLPMLPGKVLSKTQGPATAEERERMNQIPYASAVGSIMYAMLCTRPDIAHVVSLTSRYQSDPGMEHWTAVKNIMKYLKRTKDMFLCYGGDQELVVTSYTDAISWCSSKQCTVAKSSTESEYIAASEASSEAVWMKRVIVEFGVVPSALDPLVIYYDNMGAIANAQEPRSHKKLKHIKLRFHSIREYIEDGEVKICKVHTDLNVADPLTKALPRAKHDQHQNAMGVSYWKVMEQRNPPNTAKEAMRNKRITRTLNAGPKRPTRCTHCHLYTRGTRSIRRSH
ncbi:hypothetical protein QYE76_058518, partial [Lolium multiflorum]